MSNIDWFKPQVIDLSPVTDELQTLRARLREQDARLANQIEERDAEIARISDLLSASYEGNKKANDEIARLREENETAFTRGMASLARFSAGCASCHSMAWFVTASGGHRCGNCGDIFDAAREGTT